MSLSKKTLGALALALAGSSLLAANYANAALVLTIDNLGNGVGVDAIVVDDADGGVGTATAWGLSTDADSGYGAGVDGLVGFSAGVRGVEFIAELGTSSPLIPDAIDILSYTLSGAGSFRVTLSDTDFSFEPGLSLLSEMGGTTDGTVTWTAFADIVEGGTTYSVGGPFTAGPGAFSGTHSVILPVATTTLLADILVVHTDAKDLTTLDYKVSAVSEPAVLGLIGLGLAGIGAVRRKKA